MFYKLIGNGRIESADISLNFVSRLYSSISYLITQAALMLQAVKQTIEIKAENWCVAQTLVKNSLKIVMFLLNQSYI